MSDLIEKILNDIYTLDPSLSEHDAEVRNMVSVFLAEKPEVKIDTTFAHKLRESLVVSQNKPITRVSSPLAWWMYLTPIGVAVLILMLVPSRPTPVGPTELPAPVFENSLELQNETATELYDVPSSKRSAETNNEDASMMMQMSADSLPVDSFGISTQIPSQQFWIDYVSLSAPGFIVISNEEAESLSEIVGISQLLNYGLTEQIIIPLSTTTKPDQTFLAILYYDNGDGVFEQNQDTLVLDGAGSPLMQLFSTTPILLE